MTKHNLLIDKSHAIIAAHDQAFGIGKNNHLPWQIKGDLKFFRTITSTVPDKESTEKNFQNAVIMGRNTWESLPDPFKPLAGRINVVLTKKTNYSLPTSVFQHTSLNDAIRSVLAMNCGRIFVIGGGTLYQEAINTEVFDTLYITEIEGYHECDVFFPDYRDIFDLIETSSDMTENNYNYRFNVYRRKPKQ